MSRPPKQSGLGLDDPTRPVPTRPTLFCWAGGQADALRFDNLDELARKVIDLANGRGLRLALHAATTAYDGFELFPAWSLYALDDAGGEDWICHAAVQATPRERLEAAILRARPATDRSLAA